MNFLGKLIFCHFLLFFIGQSPLLSQDSNCGSIFSEDQRRHFLSLRLDNPISTRSNETIFIPIKFHNVASASGEGRMRFELVLEQLCAINENFADLGIKFYMKDGTVSNVDNNTIYENPSSAAGTSKMATEKSQNGKNAINIFITNSAGSGTGGLGTTLGYYDFNQDLIVLKKTVPANSDQLPFVLGHELGHFFSLPHTFNGWDAQPWDGTPVSSTTSPGGELNELADGSNCADAGDMICDTPADYNLGFGWDGCRDYDGGCADPSGALLDPDESNFMGYFIGCEEYLFSEEQKAIIENDYFSPRRSYLRVNFMPNDNEVGPVETLLLPEDNSTTPAFNGVHFEWEASEHATSYLVEIRQAIFRNYYTTTTPSIFIKDLKADKGYVWSVKPYSALSTCAPYSSFSSFVTGNETSSTEDLDKDGDLIVSPNPSNGKNIQITHAGEHPSPFLIDLYDLSGRLLYSRMHHTKIVSLPDLGLEKGIYVLRMGQKDKILTRKIVVNE